MYLKRAGTKYIFPLATDMEYILHISSVPLANKGEFS